MVELNRAVAVAMRDGPSTGLELIDSIMERGDLVDYYLAYSARADLYRRLGRRGKPERVTSALSALHGRSPRGDFSDEDWSNSSINPTLINEILKTIGMVSYCRPIPKYL